MFFRSLFKTRSKHSDSVALSRKNRTTQPDLNSNEQLHLEREERLRLEREAREEQHRIDEERRWEDGQ